MNTKSLNIVKEKSEIDRLHQEIEHLKLELNAYKQLAQNFNDSEKAFDQLFNNVSDGIYYNKIYKDGRAGNFINVNQVGYSRLGYTREEILKMSPVDIDIHDEDEILQMIDATFQNETYIFETTHICKDGQQIPVEIKAHMFDGEGEKYILSVCRDISVRKQTEQMMIQAEKMNVAGQLAAGIAHEIRNPLTSLKGFVQLFRSGTIPSDVFLNIMEDELERIDLISTEFLSLAKPVTTDFTKVNLPVLLKDIVALLDTEAFKQSISISTVFETEEAVVLGVSSQLKQVFINLIKNSIEVMPDGGSILIKIEKEKEYLNVSIEDKGVGMTEEQLSRIGEPFYTTKEAGTGIGLMVTYTIIENHNGKVNVKSKLNEGTTFTVQLPVISE
ncbi:ATP-binding protein [Alkalihalobacterium chitinilyticum]|uniref:ATP-binding protein n=1 Tax=Alkalihalobacterium chitinilyticum TaxID=2980103 RepID=UPI0023B081E1|nr:ATP-binding protein [Alkalihalobacterium chitinilyticum]